jgi:hypothetical protein
MSPAGASRRGDMDATNLASPCDRPLIDRERISARLETGSTQAPGTGGPNRHACWLATINADGSPHLTGIGGIWSTAHSGSRPASTAARAGTWRAIPAAR